MKNIKQKPLKNKFRVFTRNWWKLNSEWPDGIEPDSTARKTYIADRIENEEDAINICKKWNATHNPGKLSRKAEFELY